MVYLSSLYHLYPPKKQCGSTVSFLQDLELTPDFMSPPTAPRLWFRWKNRSVGHRGAPSRPSQPFARGGTRTTWPGISFTWHQWGQTMSQFVTMGLIMPGLDAQTPVKFSWESLHFHSDLDNRQLFFFARNQSSVAILAQVTLRLKQYLWRHVHHTPGRQKQWLTFSVGCWWRWSGATSLRITVSMLCWPSPWHLFLWVGYCATCVWQHELIVFLCLGHGRAADTVHSLASKMIPLMWTFSTRTRWVIWDRGCLSDWVWTLPSGTWNWPMISRSWTIPLRHSVRTIWRQDAAWRWWRSVLAPSSSITPSTITKFQPTALTCALRPGPRSFWVPWTASKFLPKPSETRGLDTRSRKCFWPSCVGRKCVCAKTSGGPTGAKTTSTASTHQRSAKYTDRDDIVSQAKPGCFYQMEYEVGHGGGHRIIVEDWVVKISYLSSSCTEPSDVVDFRVPVWVVWLAVMLWRRVLLWCRFVHLTPRWLVTQWRAEGAVCSALVARPQTKKW